MRFNKIKFKNLVHYICYSSDPQKLGTIKLNKILWYADILSYMYRDKPITGETYIKQQFGPVPKHILKILGELQEEEVLVKGLTKFHGYPKSEYVVLKEPDISGFSPEEISVIDDMIHGICENHTATSISNLTHDRIYELAKIGEEIPYFAILASRKGEITVEDVAWAMDTLDGIRQAS
jgi:hypothetical protein